MYKGVLGAAAFEEGAASHCLGENRSLMGEVLFDWLDEVFQQSEPIVQWPLLAPSPREGLPLR